MLAIGIMAIMSLGLVGMMGGSDDLEADERDVAAELPEEETDVTEVVDIPLAEEPDSDPAESEPTDAANAQPEVAEAPLAPEPVTVLQANGEEIQASLVLSDGPTTGEDADRTFVLTAPEGENSITVEYDDETTYAIEYNADTSTVFAALNSNISGPEGVVTREVIDKVDSAGTPFTETLVSQEFGGSPQIVLHIDDTYVGDHVAEIDLTNPNASLDFFFTRMEAGVHLVYDEVDTTNGDSFVTTRTLYVIETPLGVAEVSDEAKEGIIENGIDPDNEARLIAQVNLGYSELTSQSGTGDEGPFSQSITNFINEEPVINTNFFWLTDNAEEELVEDETGPNVWIGVPDDQVGVAANTGLVLEPGETFTPTSGTQTESTSTQTDQELAAQEDTSGLSTQELTQSELDRATDLLDDANQNLEDLGVRI